MSTILFFSIYTIYFYFALSILDENIVIYFFTLGFSTDLHILRLRDPEKYI